MTTVYQRGLARLIHHEIDHLVEFLDLVTACHAFVAAAGRAVPGLRDRQLGSDARLDRDGGRHRAVDVDGELARLLQGE